MGLTSTTLTCAQNATEFGETTLSKNCAIWSPEPWWICALQSILMLFDRVGGLRVTLVVCCRYSRKVEQRRREWWQETASSLSAVFRLTTSHTRKSRAKCWGLATNWTSPYWGSLYRSSIIIHAVHVRATDRKCRRNMNLINLVGDIVWISIDPGDD